MLVPPLLFLLVPLTILSCLFACKEHLSLTRIQFPKLKRIGHRNGKLNITPTGKLKTTKLGLLPTGLPM